MCAKKSQKTLVLALVTIFGTSYAQGPSVQPAKAQSLVASGPEVLTMLEAFSKGAYTDVLEKGPLVAKDPALYNQVLYLMGISANRLQRFAEGAKYLKRVTEIALKNHDELKKFPEAFYELGQALYATQNYAEAEIAFSGSIKARYKIVQCLYYKATIARALEKDKEAYILFTRVTKYPDVPKDLKQAAMYEVAEIVQKQVEKKGSKPEMVQRIVLPRYLAALDVDDQSALGLEIERRISEVERFYKLGTLPKYYNGKPIPYKRLYSYLRQRTGYNSNVTYEGVDAIQKVARKDSIFIEDTAYINYIFTEKRRVSITPDFKFLHTYYFERNNSDVYQNDSYSLAPGARTAIEHTLFKRDATFSMDYEYNYATRNYLKDNNYRIFGRTNSITTAERIPLFDFGDTTLRYRMKFFRAYTSVNNSITQTVSVGQSLRQESFLLMAFLNADFLDNNTSANSTNTFTSRIDAVFPDLGGNVTLTVGGSYGYIDTKEQKSDRGFEKLYTANIRLGKSWTPHFFTTLTFDYSQKESKNKQVYAYKQQISAMEFEYQF